MKKHIFSRIFATIFFAVGMLALVYYIYEKYISTSAYSISSGKNQMEQSFDTNKVQYRFSYKGVGNLKQIIHLNKGDAVFLSSYKGDNNYYVELKNANDSLIKVIFNTKGDYKGTEIIEVPKMMLIF